MATVSFGETSFNVVQSFRYEWRITVRHCINEANFYTIPQQRTICDKQIRYIAVINACKSQSPTFEVFYCIISLSLRDLKILLDFLC